MQVLFLYFFLSASALRVNDKAQFYEKENLIEFAQLSEPRYHIPPPGRPTFSKAEEADGSNKWDGPRIVCTGWKKSGTTSVGLAYDRLGIKPRGGVNQCKSPSCMNHYAGVEDAYTCCNQGLVQVMKQRYTRNQVKFVLTERRPEKWHASVDAWLHRKDKGSKFQRMYGQLMKATYGTPQFYSNYEKHNAFIKKLFEDEPDRLLVLNLEDDDPIENMKKFCVFVGLNQTHEHCNGPFPFANANKKIPHFQRDTAVGETTTLTDDWLYDDEDDTELDTFDPQYATMDWIKFYDKHKLLLNSSVVFDVNEF